MGIPTIRRIVIFAALALASSIALSLLFGVPYVYTISGFAGWLFLGHLITLDDDFPGGWSNPEGAHLFPWGELALKGAVFLALLLACLSPELRQWGA